MKRLRRGHVLLAILLAVVVAVLADVPGRIARRTLTDQSVFATAPPSPMPEIERTVAIRFDPSYHYRGVRPSELAKEKADIWSRAGVNLVFFRVYDPRHGAFYKTDYRHNMEGEFGKYDLLGEMLDACHKRGIRVFAWTPVLNHGGAWVANPAWRAKRSDGKDYQATGLEFPLCARNPEARRWWLGFVQDLLANYPELDGMDLGEPVVSWQADEACFCDLCREAGTGKDATAWETERARPLSKALLEAVQKIADAGRTSCVTFVQSAGTSGNLLTPAEARAITGFDLTELLDRSIGAPPDMLCPEFIWQEWRSLYGKTHGGDAIFTPDWVEGAVRAFLRRMDTPIKVLPHLEITDFEDAPVSPEDFRRSLLAALRGGAGGIDVYNASLLEKKGALASLKSLHSIAAVRRCLVLQTGDEGRGDAVQIGELLRHFRTRVDVKPVAEYKAGDLDRYDVACYVGTSEGDAIPPALVADIARWRGEFCWLGANIDALLAFPDAAARMGLRYVEKRLGVYDRVAYKDMELVKEDPATHVVKVVDPKRCRVLATALGKDGATAPYAVNSGRHFWYFADVPPMFAIEGGRFLVLADLLHDIVGENHRERRIAMIRIEDVHPLTDPASLRAIADYLHDRDVPFQVATVPFYVYPDQGISVALNEKPEFVKALRYMQEHGGTIVMHGITHQRFGETTADYEFWDNVSDTPIDGQNEETIREKIEEGLREFWAADIFPMMWETPHYAGSQLLYKIIPEYFSIAMERRQAIDKHGTDQYFPYPIRRDRFGQTILPENMGYVPLNRAEPEVITEPASKMRVVRDGVVGFFFHPFIDISVLEGIIEKLQDDGYRFATAVNEPIKVSTRFGIVTNCDTTASLEPGGPAGRRYDLKYPGLIVGHENLAPPKTGKMVVTIGGSGTELDGYYFIERYKAARSRDIDGAADVQVAEYLRHTLNHFGERCATPVVMLLDTDNASGREESQAFMKAFDVFGIQPWRVPVSRVREIPPVVNLVVAPGAAARQLTEDQAGTIADAVRAGAVSLVVTGFNALSDEMAIEKLDRKITVSRVRDAFYPSMTLRWREPAQTFTFESPGDASFLYEDIATTTPVAVSASMGEGRYIFSSTPFSASDAPGERFPYFMTHVFRSLGMFPMVRGTGYEIYFDPSERPEEIAVEDLVKQWRRMGVRSIYVAAWQVFPEWEYDYARLIELAHSNAMLVYAWFEPPYINEKFWLEHPEWRERNALDADVTIAWRKPMALGDPECFEAATDEMQRILKKHAWDGVVLNRLGWDADGGPDKPEAYTPFHPSVRAQFQKEGGFDPLELFQAGSAHTWKKHGEALEAFEVWRARKAREVFERMVRKIAAIGRSGLSDWEIILAHDTTNPFTGLTLEDYQALREAQACKLMRRASLEDQWETGAATYDLNSLTITSASGDRETFHGSAPTRYPTGLALYGLLQKHIETGHRFALNSENSIYEIDTRYMPFLYAAPTRTTWSDQGLILVSPESAEVTFWNKPAVENVALDGDLAGSYAGGRLVLPIGEHRISLGGMRDFDPTRIESGARVVDCSADLVQATPRSRGILVKYRADRRAIVVLNQKPEEVEIDGTTRDVPVVHGIPGYAVLLPAGSHRVDIATRSWFETAMLWVSLSLSRLIVAISIGAVALMGIIFLIVRVQSHRHARRKAA